MLPNEQSEAQYVTYIKEEPVPDPPPTPPVTPEEVKELTMVMSEETDTMPPQTSLTNSRACEKFIEVGEAEGHVTRYLIDADQSQQRTEVPAERVPVSVQRVADPNSGQEEQMAILALTELDQVDVVMCFDARDVGLATVLEDELRDSHLHVVTGVLPSGDTTPGEDFVNTARAIFNTSALVVLLSPTSVDSRHVQDLVSLATLTHTSVFPVVTGSRSNVEQLMSIELKLQLGGCRWTDLAKTGRDVLEGGFGQLVTMIRQQTDTQQKYAVIDEDYGQVSSWAVRHQRAMRLEKQEDQVKIVSSLNEAEDEAEQEAVKTGEVNNPPGSKTIVMTATDFWDLTFPQNTAVPFDKFRAQLRSHYLNQISTQIPRSLMNRLMKALRESLVLRDTKGTEYISRDIFINFCSNNGSETDVWQTICDVARHQQAVIDVFDKQSTVRTVAIEEITSYGSPAVVSGLRELIQDGDPHIRCMAVESLSRCMLIDDQTSLSSLMAALNDTHWEVRKVACQGTARLGAPQAVDTLRRLGQTDTNAQVRVAAAASLSEIEAGNPKPEVKSSH
ncbi:hypothetical protein ElyMa_000554100 [Elysia marginata]|uniref:TIR domain-containing protein n=1 Tax=Elysia marginata TaxID=1093978 RepID=A0AAV4G1D3_9GAST|nr:hypothetical protein ElyMa_000554100 [Elysia marginata]